MSSDTIDRMVILVEVTGYTDTSTYQVYRFANRLYWTWPSDTPANTEYQNRVVDPGFFKRQLFADAESGARSNPSSEVDYGAITLTNIDGALDSIFGGGSSGISFRERPIRVYRVQDGRPYSEAQLIYRAAISQIQLTRQSVTISIKDRSYELNSPHLSITYLGNNALPSGVEGGADLFGKVKPVIMGKVLSWSAPCVNTSLYIYQLNSTSIQDAVAYDGGVALTRGADYTSQSDMETNAPAAGGYRLWITSTGSYARIQTKPTFRLLFDVTADTAANSTVAQILKRLVLYRNIDPADISASDVTALDALNSAVTGIPIDDSTNTKDLMDQVALSIGACWRFDQLGVLRMSRFDMPAATGVCVVANWNCASLEQITNGEDIPTLDVRIKYARYWQPLLAGQFAGSITGAAYADLQEQWRVSKYTPTLVLNPNKRTLIMERETLLTTKSAADAEAARFGAIVSAPRRTYVASKVFLDDDVLPNIDLNKTVELRWDRYGFDPVFGTPRLVIAMTFYLASMSCDLTLWGA